MRILVVDDDRAILKLIARVLHDEAYAVDTASTGEEARMLALVNEYDGIILDLQLGDRHGFEILQELRRNGRRTPVLLYSGQADTDSIVRGLDAGADDYVVKPVSNEELRARVRTLVRRGAGSSRVGEQISVGKLTLRGFEKRCRKPGRLPPSPRVAGWASCSNLARQPLQGERLSRSGDYD